MRPDRLAAWGRDHVRIVAGGVVAIALVVTVVGWVRGADERRVDAACDTWLVHRDSLRTHLLETEEALGRARHDRSVTLARHFNDIDTARGWADSWLSLRPRTTDTLDERPEASRLERSAAFVFRVAHESLVVMTREVEEGDLDGVAWQLPNLAATYQGIDDVCLAAARG